jgi:hypothetical protein
VWSTDMNTRILPEYVVSFKCPSLQQAQGQWQPCLKTLNWCCSCSQPFLLSHAVVQWNLVFSNIGSDLGAEEAFTGVSWHVPDPSSGDSAVRAGLQAADIAGDLQSLQGTLLFFAW